MFGRLRWWQRPQEEEAQPPTDVQQEIQRTYAWNSSVAWNSSTMTLRTIRDYLVHDYSGYEAAHMTEVENTGLRWLIASGEVATLGDVVALDLHPDCYGKVVGWSEYGQPRVEIVEGHPMGKELTLTPGAMLFKRTRRPADGV